MRIGAIAAANVVLLAAVALGQQATRPSAPKAEVLVGEPRELGDKIEVVIGPSAEPRLAVVRGRRARGGNASLEIDGAVWGTVAGFPPLTSGGDLFDAALPIAPSAGTKTSSLVIRPSAPGVTVDRVELVPASRVRFTIRDQGSKALIPGEASVDLVEGGPPPPLGPIGGFPRERATWISADGHGDLYARAGSTVTFVARSTPFRGLDRQRHVLDARDNLLVNFLMPADQLPEGATILEGPPRPGIAPEVQRAADKARGIGKRPKGFRIVPAGELLTGGLKAMEQALANPDVKFLATNETGPLLCPPPLLVTAELPGGELLHSNGPVILLVDRRRESGAVRAFVKIRLPEGVVADRLIVWAGAKKVEHSFSGPSTIPLDVIVPPKTPIALIVTGPAPRDGSPLPPAAAFRMFRAP
jgi:hypothetical protein